jgi:3D (Asp-Asp-Asp) domain-containing protein
MPVLNTVIGNHRRPSEHVAMPESAPTSAAASRPANRRSVGVALAGVAALLSLCLSGAIRHVAVDAPASKTVATARPTTRPAQPETVINFDFGWESLLVRQAEATGTIDSAAEPAAFSIAATPAAGGELLHDATSVTLTQSAEQPEAATPVVETPAKLRKVRTIRMQVTAYCACKKCCGSSARGLTASGRRVTYNGGAFVAADTDLLPFGTRLVIPGYHNGKPVEVIDRGGAIKGRHIDLFFPSHEQALEWGNQWLDVTVVE